MRFEWFFNDIHKSPDGSENYCLGFIYVIEHTITKGGGVKKSAHQVGRPERVCPQI